jgi:hypothetical protein
VKTPDDGYDLDAEIAQYGGCAAPRMSPVAQQIEAADKKAPVATPVPFDLDAEIAKYGGHPSVERPGRATAGDPLAALRESDPSFCQQVEAFVNLLGASVDIVIPQGAPDPRLAGGLFWPRWERRRLEQVFRIWTTN